MTSLLAEIMKEKGEIKTLIIENNTVLLSYLFNNLRALFPPESCL
jgi:hypothetical protein